MTETNPQKTFVKLDGTAVIHCPECHLVRNISVGKFRGTGHSITVRCTCGHSYAVHLDFRGAYRKKTSLTGIYEIKRQDSDHHTHTTRLTGVYTMLDPMKGSDHVTITNISNGGLQFIASSNHAIEKGQEALISFTLDDRNQTQIRKRVVIQSVNGHIIGCRFAVNEHLEQALRFYLFP